MSGTIQPAQTGSLTVASGAFGVFPVSYGYYPAEGSRCVTAQYNWTTQGYAEDLSGLPAMGVETTIQSAFIDNSSNPQAVTLTVGGTGQVVVIPPNSQTVVPLFFVGTPSYSISVPTVGAASAVTRVYLLNVPCGSGGWGTTGAPAPAFASGATAVGATGELGMAIVNITPGANYPANTLAPLQCDAQGWLHCTLGSGGNGSTAMNFGNGMENLTVGGQVLTAPPELVNGNFSGLILDQYAGAFVNTEANAPTYTAATPFPAQINATDVFTISGSATKTIRIHSIMITCNTAVLFTIQRRSTLNTGGTFAVTPNVPHDPNSAAGTAVVTTYTVNPATTGTVVGSVEAIVWTANAAALEFRYGVTDQSMVLRGVNQSLAMNFGAGNAQVATMAIKVKWSEV